MFYLSYAVLVTLWPAEERWPTGWAENVEGGFFEGYYLMDILDND